MPVEILLAAAGTGKTETALQRLVSTIQQQPFAQVWVLVSGRRQEDAFRQRLAERYTGQQVYFNIEFFTFYQLYHRLLNLAQQPPRKLDDSARFGLLRAILEQLQREGKLPLYGAIAQTPGLVRIVAEFIYELKQNIIHHENFLEAACQSQSAKDLEISLIYSVYQQRLIDSHVVDREGEGWLALNTLQNQRLDIGRNIDLLIVDGYDQFTRLQAQLLMLLAERAQKSLITLTTVPEREETIGRRFKKALERLLEFAQSPPTIIEYKPPFTQIEQRPPALRHLLDSIFRPGVLRQPAGNSVSLIEAPDPAHESAAVLRQVKRLLLFRGCQPDDILIAVRDWGRYAHHFDRLGRIYGVPFTLHRGEPIAVNPAVMMLFNLLNLHTADFRRRDLLDVLRSPYFNVPGLDAAQIDQLERISQTFIVTAGRALWLEAIARATQPLRKGDDEQDEPEDAILNVAEATSLRKSLAAFFDAVTPPVRTTLENYMYWLDNLIGDDSESDPDDGDEAPRDPIFSLRMPHQIKQQSAPGVVERDLAAIHELKRALRSLLSGQMLLKSLGESGELDRAAFLLEMQTAVNNTMVNRGAGRSGRVLVTTVADARGLPHPHVFIPGLSEGIFPAQVTEDPLYLDTERRALGIGLETQAERAADDGLFYELISLAQETLTLSRPTAQDGIPWAASHLWRGVTAVFSDLEVMRIGSGAVVGAGDVISHDEMMLALADGLGHEHPSGEVLSLYNWVMAEQPDDWGRIHHARLVELNRASRRQPHDRYSGRLSDPNLVAYIASELGEGRRWSASQLNDYGICGFRFFAKRLLKLEALEEPEEALDAAVLGTINHEILERAYREIARRGLFVKPENTDEALTILREIAPPVLAKAPDNLGFRESVKWEQEKKLLMRRLEQLIRQDFSDENPVMKQFGSGTRQPYLLEAPFGTDGGVIVRLPIVVAGKNEALQLHGYIDRMDRIGDSVIVIDYKTGSTKIPVNEIEIGRNFQMMVYLRAAEYILAAQNDPDRPKSIEGGLFWHIRSQQTSGELGMNEDGIKLLELAEKYIGRYIAAGRRGDFAARANKVQESRCTHYCEYSQLCRMSSTHRHKPNG
jgi:ATP-dependent helicase/DNAse subunit B